MLKRSIISSSKFGANIPKVQTRKFCKFLKPMSIVIKSIYLPVCIPTNKDEDAAAEGS